MRIKPAWDWFEQLDRLRRVQGMAMDSFGFGPSESPHQIVFSEAGARLRRYGAGDRSGPLVLIVPAPIKRPYIWDLAPERSAVRRCLETGMQVCLIEWQECSEEFGLAEFAERLILDCLEAAGARRAVLVAHSLGGLFAALFAALHPERVRGLALLTSPLHFGTGAGVLGSMVEGLEADDLPASMPGSFLSSASLRASPGTFAWDRWLDFWHSLPSAEALRSHLQVERWTLDEFPLPRRLVAELAVWLAREDRFVRGELVVGGRRAAPAQVAAPLLCVLDPRCRLVPPEAVLPFFEAAASRDKTLLHYPGDIGVSLQHVGILVGRQAHRQVWPEIVRWIRSRALDRDPA
jgi:polyhydroxyalkanoate synthase